MFSKIKLPLLLSAIIVLSITTSGCGAKDESKSKHYSHSAIGDIREETTSKSVLPSFLDEKPEQMSMIYKAVVNHKELIEQMPCYCGCGETVDHKSNYDCFVYDHPGDSSVIWDAHATRCGVCLETAVESINRYENGESIKEIRDFIDNRYNEEDYGKPTATPPVTS